MRNLWETIISFINRFGDEVLFFLGLEMFRSQKSKLLDAEDEGEATSFILHPDMKDGEIRQIMDSFRPALLMKLINQLRDFHRNEIISRKRNLDHVTAQSLDDKFNAGGIQVIKELWQHFLRPNPWHTLLTSSIQSPSVFYQSFCRWTFPKEHFRWRDRGLASGLVERLMKLVDESGSGFISFEECVKFHLRFKNGRREEREDLAFRFTDFSDSGYISVSDLARAYQILHVTYNGVHDPAESLRDATLLFNKVREHRLLKQGQSLLSNLHQQVEEIPPNSDSCCPQKDSKVLYLSPTSLLSRWRKGGETKAEKNSAYSCQSTTRDSMGSCDSFFTPSGLPVLTEAIESSEAPDRAKLLPTSKEVSIPLRHSESCSPERFGEQAELVEMRAGQPTGTPLPESITMSEFCLFIAMHPIFTVLFGLDPSTISPTFISQKISPLKRAT